MNLEGQATAPSQKVETKWFAGYISLNKHSMLTLKCINVPTTVAKEVMHTYLGSHQWESSAYH